jgi:signal transduction histidine kinase
MRVVTIALYWALAVLASAATVGTTVSDYAVGGPAASHAGGALIYLPFYAAGVFAFWRRPDHPAARRLLVVASLLGLYTAAGDLISVLYLARGFFPGLWLANTVDKAIGIAISTAVLGLFAVFPDGRYQRAYERWIVRIWAALIPTVPVLELVSHPNLYFNHWIVWSDPTLPNPFYVPALAVLAPVLRQIDDQTLVPFVIAAGLVAARYRRFPAEQRRQIKWPLLGLLTFVPVPISLIFVQLGLIPAWVNGSLFVLAIVLLPVSLAIGIVRHQLLDIDLVIRKSLVYGALWLAIALTYAGLAVLLGIAAGQRYPVGLAVVLTIAAAMAFQPVRRWLERLADRWVFGHRLSGYELVRSFGAALQETSALDQLAPRVAATVREGLGVRWARVVVERETHDGLHAEVVGAEGISSDDPGEARATAALVHGGDRIGRIECGPKVEGGWLAADQDLLESLGRQAALAIHNSRLAAELAERLEELRASRSRIIRAEDVERRRIERNIHDGVQQDLVALMAKLGLARAQLTRDPALVDATLARLQDETRRALEELRELARGIHPPVLTDRGILEALEAVAARLPLGVAIDVDRSLEGRRFAEETEAAAYFLVCEALTNSVKHASARQARIRLTSENGRLSVEVSDDGQGFDPRTTTRAGLAGLADRVEAVGGEVQIRSRPGEGTTVSATLPIREPSHA